MIKVDIKPRTDAKVDIYANDGQNGNDLVNSSQGYQNHGDAVEQAERLFGDTVNARKLAMIRELVDDEEAFQFDQIRAIIDDPNDQPEPVELTIHWRNGTTDSRRIR